MRNYRLKVVKRMVDFCVFSRLFYNSWSLQLRKIALDIIATGGVGEF